MREKQNIDRDSTDRRRTESAVKKEANTGEGGLNKYAGHVSVILGCLL
jgi:hypothetical protein